MTPLGYVVVILAVMVVALFTVGTRLALRYVTRSQQPREQGPLSRYDEIRKLLLGPTSPFLQYDERRPSDGTVTTWFARNEDPQRSVFSLSLTSDLDVRLELGNNPELETELQDLLGSRYDSVRPR